MIEITVESAVAALKAAVAEKGADHVYESGTSFVAGPPCQYARKVDGVAVPDCIVGNVLAQHGLDPELMIWKDYGDGEMETAVNPYASGVAVEVLTRLERDGLATVEDGVFNVLGVAQGQQDSGETWGDSVSVALEDVN